MTEEELHKRIEALIGPETPPKAPFPCKPKEALAWLRPFLEETREEVLYFLVWLCEKWNDTVKVVELEYDEIVIDFELPENLKVLIGGILEERFDEGSYEEKKGFRLWWD